MGTRKGKLFELASTFQTYQKRKVKDLPRKAAKDQPSMRMKNEPVRKNAEKKKVELKRDKKGEHFDDGKAISLSYSFDEFPEGMQPAGTTFTSGMNVWDNDHSEAFYVEPFDAEEFVETPYREVDAESHDAQDARIENIVRSFSKTDDEHEDLSDDEEKLGDMEKKIDGMFGGDDDSNAMEFTGQEPPKDAAEYHDEPSAEPAPDQVNVAKPMAYEVSDEEFARDIGAILQGQKVYDAEQKKAVGRETTTPGAPLKSDKQDSSAKSPKEDVLDAGKNEHKIFEKIAQSMTYANSYDLGAIALEEKFQLMDREIEKDEVNAVLKDKSAVQYADVVEEQKTESGAMQLEGKFDPKIPLDHLNGGRMLKLEDVQKGDLILMSSAGATGIVNIPAGDECIVGLYLGNKKMLTRGDGDILIEKSFDSDLISKGVVTTLRHHNMSVEKASVIADTLGKLNTAPQTNWIKYSCPSIAPHSDVCNAAADKTKCNSFAGKIQLGTMGNDSFMCAESIVNAFEKNQLPFIKPLTKEHNGSLRYFGHLKNKP